MKKSLMLTISIFGLMLTLSASVWALPSSSRLFQAKYGFRAACDGCHRDGGGSPLNEYGDAFKKAGRDANAFAKLENDDSDKDGESNIVEIKAKSNPGSGKSTSKTPGDWLAKSDEIFIPKDDLKKLLPDIEEYKTLEGKLSDEQVAKAKDKGVTLMDDDTVPTFYFPVKDNVRQGVVQIVPVNYNGKQLNLGVFVGKDGKIVKVIPLKTKELPEAEKLGVYKTLEGQKDITAPANATSLEGMVQNGANRALATILVVFSKQ